MKSMLSLRLFIPLLTITILASNSFAQSPLRKYISPAKTDKFNPGPEGKKLVPKQGGKIVIRTPADPRILNPFVTTGATADEMMGYLYSTLVSGDPETLEVQPTLSWKVEIRDLVTLKDGTKIEGIIQTQTDTQVSIIENAGRVIVGKQDFAKIKSPIKNKKELDWTITFDTDPGKPAREIQINDIGIWEDKLGKKVTKRPSVKDQVVLYFYMRDKINWQDGEPITVDNFKLSYDTIMNPKVDAPQFLANFQDVESLETPDKSTIKFVYKQPHFQALLLCGSLKPLPSHVINPERFNGDPDGYAEFFNTYKMYLPSDKAEERIYVGCGPFQLVHWLQGKEVVLERNPNYWAKNHDLAYEPKDQPYLDKIIWTVINNKTAGLKELVKGTVDADFDVEPDTWFRPDTNSTEFKMNLVRAKSIVPLFTYIGWNMKRELFKSKEVRTALTMLIPREKILQDIHKGLGRVVSGPFFIDGPANNSSIKPLAYDVRKAKRMLRKEGWIDRDGDGIIEKNGTPFEFEYMIHTARDYHTKIADIIKENVEQAGVQMTIKKMDWSVFGETTKQKNFDAVRYAWGAVFDPDPFNVWHSTQAENDGNNMVSYSNPRVDEICEQVRRTFDAEKRWTMLREMHKIINEDQPYTFLFCFDSTMFYNKKFRNIKLYSTGYGRNFNEWCMNYDWE